MNRPKCKRCGQFLFIYHDEETGVVTWSCGGKMDDKEFCDYWSKLTKPEKDFLLKELTHRGDN